MRGVFVHFLLLLPFFLFVLCCLRVEDFLIDTTRYPFVICHMHANLAYSRFLRQREGESTVATFKEWKRCSSRVEEQRRDQADQTDPQVTRGKITRELSTMYYCFFGIHAYKCS